MPVLCGMLAAEIAEKMHEDGMRLCSKGGLMLAVSHLYRICQKHGGLSVTWDALEHFLASQGAENLGLPTTSSPNLLHAARTLSASLGVERAFSHSSIPQLPSPEATDGAEAKGPRSAEKHLKIESELRTMYAQNHLPMVNLHRDILERLAAELAQD